MGSNPAQGIKCFSSNENFIQRVVRPWSLLNSLSLHIYIYIIRENELVFVHIFDLQICFVGVYPTRQDLDDNVNSWVFIYHSLEITIIRCFLVKICLHAYKCSQVLFFC